MKSDPPPPPNSSDTLTPEPTGCSRPGTIVLIAVIVTVAMGLGAIAGRCSAEPSAKAPGPKAVTTLTAAPTVITAIRELSRLEGSRFYMERVIELTETQRRFFDLVEVEDAILLVAAGDVVSGVDLAKLREGDVRIDAPRKRASITLPKAEILSSRLDNERTYVHRRDTDFAARRKETLETEARQHAEKALVEAALAAQVLKHGEQGVKRTVEALVRSLGYSEVDVSFRE